MFDKQTLVSIHIREAESLYRMLDGTPEELTRLAGNYGVSLGDWTSWVTERIGNQLKKARIASQKLDHPLSVGVDADTAKFFRVVYPIGNALFTAKLASAA